MLHCIASGLLGLCSCMRVTCSPMFIAPKSDDNWDSHKLHSKHRNALAHLDLLFIAMPDKSYQSCCLCVLSSLFLFVFSPHSSCTQNSTLVIFFFFFTATDAAQHLAGVPPLSCLFNGSVLYVVADYSICASRAEGTSRSSCQSTKGQGKGQKESRV